MDTSKNTHRQHIFGHLIVVGSTPTGSGEILSQRRLQQRPQSGHAQGVQLGGAYGQHHHEYRCLHDHLIIYGVYTARLRGADGQLDSYLPKTKPSVLA